MRRYLAGLAGLGALGCSASKEAGASGSSAYDAAPGGDSTTEPTETPSDTDAEPLDPTWLTIGGFLQVTAGVPDLVASDLTITGSDPEGLALCTAEGVPAGFTDALPVPPGLASWWDLDLPTPDVACALPTTLRLGLGAYDTLLDPAAAAGISGTPYGLYTNSSDDALWVFGVAGTASNFSGVDAPVVDAPLPDGYYRLQSLVLLPL